MPIHTSHTSRISQLILEQLAVSERRVLSLTVAIGKTLSRSQTVKGNLTAMVKSELRKLLDAGAIVDVDGMYSLSATK
jgi:hypothetical protein